MAVAATPREVYLVVDAAFQFGFAALIVLASGRVNVVRIGFAAILAMNGAGALHDLLRLDGLVPAATAWITDDLFDPLIVLTIPFVLSQFPTPIGGARGTRIAAGAWIVSLALWCVVLAVLGRRGEAALAAPKILFHTVPFIAAAFLLQMHLVPRWCDLPRGPLRVQTLLVGAGLGIGVYRAGLNAALQITLDGSATALAFMDTALLVAIAFVVTGALARIVAHARARGARDAWAFAGLLALAPVILVVDRFTAAGFGEFASETLRPLLLALATLRYDFFQLPGLARKGLAPATFMAFVVALFLALALVIQREGRDAVALGALPATAALLVIAVGVIAFRRPLVSALRYAAGDAAAPERLDRYRLALERARGEPASIAPARELAELRDRLRITDDEHDTLAAIVAHNMVIPTAAIRGVAPGARVAGRYEIVRELGRGGFGRALLARDLETAGVEVAGALVVLKEALRPWDEGAEARRASLEREASVGAALTHPRLARVRGLVSDGYNSYLVRDYVAGETLDELVKREGPLAPERARALILDVLDGLAALHDAGLLHLDLKPANVVVDEHGRAVIIDFGTARRHGGAGGDTLATATAPAAGTLAWMAPEQIAGGHVDERTDVYAVGASIYFLLSGAPPLRGELDMAVREEAPAMRRAAWRALSRERAERFMSAKEFADSLG